ncbi:hypothetical protein ACFORL_08395 [Legionella dresdenensis]|uniref:Uncharacterized protein n=1 Tax=Legionella dresdenensis TaxID=450200 RepID=A0ABV8CFV1_9GAMM
MTSTKLILAGLEGKANSVNGTEKANAEPQFTTQENSGFSDEMMANLLVECNTRLDRKDFTPNS